MHFLQTHAAISLSLACVLWTVQLVIYPAFRFIDPALFARWHNGYTGAITWIVAPLILLQTGGVAGRLIILGRPDFLWGIEAISTLLAWFVTVAVSVPIHAKLQQARCEHSMQRLVSTNWLRTAAWTATAICSWLAARQF
jgi:uncharacterized membrane protein